MKCVSCIAATSTLKFIGSASNRANLVETLSSLRFNVARFKFVRPTYLTQFRLRARNPPEWGSRRPDAGGWNQVQSWLGRPWKFLRHPSGTLTLERYKKVGEHKSGPSQYIGMTIFSARGAPIPPALCRPDWFPQRSATSPLYDCQSNEERRSPWVHPKINMSLSFIVLSDMRRFKLFSSDVSMVDVSSVSVQK